MHAQYKAEADTDQKNLEAKGLEAKGLEAKDLEAKGLEAKGLEAKGLEAKVTDEDVDTESKTQSSTTRFRSKQSSKLMAVLGAVSVTSKTGAWLILFWVLWLCFVLGLCLGPLLFVYSTQTWPHTHAESLRILDVVSDLAARLGSLAADESKKFTTLTGVRLLPVSKSRARKRQKAGQADAVVATAGSNMISVRDKNQV